MLVTPPVRHRSGAGWPRPTGNGFPRRPGGERRRRCRGGNHRLGTAIWSTAQPSPRKAPTACPLGQPGFGQLGRTLDAARRPSLTASLAASLRAPWSWIASRTASARDPRASPPRCGSARPAQPPRPRPRGILELGQQHFGMILAIPAAPDELAGHRQQQAERRGGDGGLGRRDQPAWPTTVRPPPPMVMSSSPAIAAAADRRWPDRPRCRPPCKPLSRLARSAAGRPAPLPGRSRSAGSPHSPVPPVPRRAPSRR